MSTSRFGEILASRIGVATSTLTGFAAVSWLVGYAIWVLYALRYGLGWIDPLDLKTRAIVFGAAPTLLLASFYPLWLAARRFYGWTQRDAVAPWERRIGGLLTMSGVVAFVLFLLFNWFADDANPWTQRFVLIWMFCWLIASLFTGKGNDRFNKFLAVAYATSVVAFVLVVLIGAYAWFAFPQLPQELGGPGSKCAVLDLDVGKLSAETRSVLANDSTSGAATGRSRQLQLVLETERHYYVRMIVAPEEESSFFRLRSEHVLGVLHCPDMAIKQSTGPGLRHFDGLWNQKLARIEVAV